MTEITVNPASASASGVRHEREFPFPYPRARGSYDSSRCREHWIATVADPPCPAIVVSGTSFALNGENVSYRFHVDPETGDLITDHFGGPVSETPPAHIGLNSGGWSTAAHLRREFPDAGRGDFRVPAVQIMQAGGHALCDFRYRSHEVRDGKPGLEGLPATFGGAVDVKTLVVSMYDEVSKVAADLSYSVFPKHDAIARSVKITNEGSEKIVIDRLSTSVDLPYDEYDMLALHGEWSRERTRVRRKVAPGVQGYAQLHPFPLNFTILTEYADSVATRDSPPTSTTPS